MTSKLIIYCEGSTEREFCRDVLIPFLRQKGIEATPQVCKTGYSGGVAHKGGVSKYSKIRDEIQNIHNDPNVIITTMFDHYGFPKDAPGYSDTVPVDELESLISKDMSCERLIFNLVEHEFEALLFSNPDVFSIIFSDSTQKKIKAVLKKYGCPENINSSPSNAPSKQISKIIPEYRKATDGVDLSEMIGIETMMKECPHFGKWIGRILSDSRLRDT